MVEMDRQNIVDFQARRQADQPQREAVQDRRRHPSFGPTSPSEGPSVQHHMAFGRSVMEIAELFGIDSSVALDRINTNRKKALKGARHAMHYEDTEDLQQGIYMLDVAYGILGLPLTDLSPLADPGER